MIPVKECLVGRRSKQHAEQAEITEGAERFVYLRAFRYFRLFRVRSIAWLKRQFDLNGRRGHPCSA
jgi:hypothetical protein